MLQSDLANFPYQRDCLKVVIEILLIWDDTRGLGKNRYPLSHMSIYQLCIYCGLVSLHTYQELYTGGNIQNMETIGVSSRKRSLVLSMVSFGGLLFSQWYHLEMVVNRCKLRYLITNKSFTSGYHINLLIRAYQLLPPVAEKWIFLAKEPMRLCFHNKTI